jgi:hypothetical protein
MTYHQLVLDRPVILEASGAAVESLDLVQLLADPGMLRNSLLCDLPRELVPQTSRPALPVLRPFEAVTWAATRAA